MEYWCTVVGANNRSIPMQPKVFCGLTWRRFDQSGLHSQECVPYGDNRRAPLPQLHQRHSKCGFLKMEDSPKPWFQCRDSAGVILDDLGPWLGLNMTWPPAGTLLRLEPYHSCAHTKQHDRHLGCARSWDAGGTRTLFGSGSTSFMTSFRKSMYKRRIKDTELCCLCSAHFQSRPWIWRPTSRLAVFRNLEPLTDQKGTAAGPPRSNYCQVQDLPQRLEWDTGLPKNTLDVFFFFFQSLTINKYIDI